MGRRRCEEKSGPQTPQEAETLLLQRLGSAGTGLFGPHFEHESDCTFAFFPRPHGDRHLRIRTSGLCSFVHVITQSNSIRHMCQKLCHWNIALRTRKSLQLSRIKI